MTRSANSSALAAGGSDAVRLTQRILRLMHWRSAPERRLTRTGITGVGFPVLLLTWTLFAGDLLGACLPVDSKASILIPENPENDIEPESTEVPAANRYRILSSAEEPVEGAVVRLIYQRHTFRELITHDLKHETKTDADGYFEYPAGLSVANDMDSGGISATWVTIPARDGIMEESWLLGMSAGVRFPAFEAVAAIMQNPEAARVHVGTVPDDNSQLLELPRIFRLPRFKTAIRAINADGSPAAGVEVTPSQIGWAHAGGAQMLIVVPEILRDSFRRISDADGRVTFMTIDRMEFGELEFRSAQHGLQRTFTNGNTIGPELEGDVMLFPVGRVSGRIKPNPAVSDSLKGQELLLKTMAVNTGLPVPKGYRLAMEGFAAVTLDDDGGFEIPAMLAGRMTLVDRSLPDAETRIVLAEHSTVSPGKPAVIEGRGISTVKVTGLLRKRDTEEPVAGAAIAVRHGGPKSGLSMEQTAYATTDLEGRFSARVLPGSIGYTSMTSVEGTVCDHFWDQNWDGDRPYGKHATVPERVGSLELPTLELLTTRSIRGKLIDASGKPVAGTGVYVRSRKTQAGNDFATTNALGEFTLTQFPQGYEPGYAMAGAQSYASEVRIVSRNPLILQMP